MLLEQGLTELDLTLDPGAEDKLLELARFVGRWASRVNLTGHRDLSEIMRWLVLDALALAPYLPAGEALVDLGSGAGFPGIPLAILAPGRRITLVDSRRRRHHFQRAAIRRLKLSNVRALLGRSETICQPAFDVVVAQALASPLRAVELMYPWLLEGGWLALASGPDGPGPITGVPGLGPGQTRSYRVPTLSVSRTVWIAQRIG